MVYFHLTESYGVSFRGDLPASASDLCCTCVFGKSHLVIEGIDRMNFRTFDLNLLKVLDALLREGSTVGAARRLGLSQSAVSSALNRLRQSIGDELLVRRGGRLEPTDFALGLADPLRKTLGELESLLEADAFEPATSDACIRISGPDYYSDMVLPRLAEIVEAEAPNMRLQMFDLVPEDHFATLDRYEVDIILMPEGPLPDWASTQPSDCWSGGAIPTWKWWIGSRPCRSTPSASWGTFSIRRRGTSGPSRMTRSTSLGATDAWR